jgi:alkylation response protein AidB-like acyl-CoA dehydrogenase
MRRKHLPAGYAGRNNVSEFYPTSMTNPAVPQNVDTAHPRDLQQEAAEAALAENAAAFLRQLSPLQRLREWQGRSPRFDRAMWSAVGRSSWPAVLVPAAQGGLGLDVEEAVAILREVGRHPIPEPVLASAGHAPTILRELPDSPMRNELLQEIAGGRLIVGVAWQEATGGAEDALPVGTTADERAGRVELNGYKQWVVPGRGADGWLVAAWSSGGPGWYWVPAKAIGPEDVQDLSRVDGSSMGKLMLNELSLPQSHCLGQGDAAQNATERGNDVARLLQAAELLGVAERAFELSLERLREGAQEAQRLGDSRAIQDRMVDALIQLDLARAVLRESLAVARRGELSRGASRAKARCAHAALQITRLAVQVHGATGLDDESDVGFYFRRALHLNTWLGTASAHRLRHLAHNSSTAEQARREHEPQTGTSGRAYNDAEFDSKTAQRALELLRRAAEWRGLMQDGAFRARLAKLELDVEDLSACYADYARVVQQGQPLPARASVVKIWAAETTSQIAAQLAESCEEDGGTLHSDAPQGETLDAVTPLLQATITMIDGRLPDVHRSILAKQVLHLPG